jgi:hypothetical protein
MSSLQASPEPTSAERLAALEQHLVQVTAERDQLVHERDHLAHERDQYKSRADWLHAQLERLRYDAKIPRERVDPRQIQLVFEPFAQALLGTAMTADATELPDDGASTPPDPDEAPDKKNKRKQTPHGRRVLPEHLPIETIVLTPAPLPEQAVQIGTEVSFRLGYRRGGYYRLRVLRPIYVASKEEAAKSTEVDATLVETSAPPVASAPSAAEAATGNICQPHSWGTGGRGQDPRRAASD